VQSTKKAAKLWKRAVELGNVDAMARLGFLYSKGDGVKLDNKKAIELYRIAADRGVVQAQYLLGRLLDEVSIAHANTEMAKLEAKPASERREGEEDALVTWLNAGRESVSKQVFRYCRLSAEKGYVPAMLMVGMAHREGQGVERDLDEARRWLERAAAKGNAQAVAALGEMNA